MLKHTTMLALKASNIVIACASGKGRPTGEVTFTGVNISKDDQMPEGRQGELKGTYGRDSGLVIRASRICHRTWAL